jgi:hypothetical protein
MSIIFRYVHIPRADGTLRKAPYIPIYVRNKSGRLIRVVALLDSGADNTVVPKDLALVLGLKEKETDTETGGIGGKVRVKESTLQLRVKNERERYSLTVPVLVMQDKSSDVPLLLGRNSFFENFDITFRQNEEKIILKKVSKKLKFK